MLMPRRKVPGLTVETLNHGKFDLAREKAEPGTATCFYRERHFSELVKAFDFAIARNCPVRSEYAEAV